MTKAEADEYLRRADRWALAEIIPDPDERIELQDIANIYMRLAERVKSRDEPDGL